MRATEDVASLRADLASELSLDPAARLADIIERFLRQAAEAWCLLAPICFEGAKLYHWRCFSDRIADSNLCQWFGRVVENTEASQNGGISAMVRDLMLEEVDYSCVKQVPNRQQARCLRLVTGVLPAFLRQVSTRGPGRDVYKVWQLLWMDANGNSAPEIAKALQPKFNWRGNSVAEQMLTGKAPTDMQMKELRRQHYDENPIMKRNQVWRLRRKALDDLAGRLEVTPAS